MSQRLEKLINLSRKTGDRIIVFDPQKSDDGYIIMPVEDYEKIVIGKNEVRGLTENEMLDKINRDIAVWKSDGKFDMETENEDHEDIEEWKDLEEYDYEKSMKWGAKKEEEEKNSGNKWGIPKTREEAAAEVIKDEVDKESENDEINDEDTQYLEEIKF